MKRSLFLKACDWVETFMLEHQLFPKSGKALVALSGGADSVFLALVLKEMKKRGQLETLELIHFHHGTRIGQDLDEVLVREFSKDNKLPLKVEKLSFENSQKNFEMRAREARYSVLGLWANEGYTIYLGHHIDDSFEWSLMQQFKSSQGESTKGIPLKNGPYFRPLMCMTSSQIRNILKSESIPFVKDPTNLDVSHERNYVRQVIIPPIKKRYPSYLKNYVVQQNEMVRKSLKWIEYKDELGGIWLSPPGADVLEAPSFEQLNEVLKKVSGLGRGKCREQFQKMIKTHKNPGKKEKGPFSLAGGVVVYLFSGHFYFCHKRHLENWENLDKELQNHISAQITACGVRKILNPLGKLKKKPLSELIYSGKFPQNKQWGPSRRRIFPLLPKSTQSLMDQGLWFQVIMH